MEKVGGRPRDDVWQHVVLLEGGRRVKCKHCGWEFARGASRIRSHINGEKGKGIRVCPNFVSGKANSKDLRDNLLHSQQGQIQAEANNQERIQVGSSSVFVTENEKQDGNKRLRVDGVNRHDPLEKGSSKGYILPTTNLIGDSFEWNVEEIYKSIISDDDEEEGMSDDDEEEGMSDDDDEEERKERESPIGIWGRGGSGKTALATYIHNKLIIRSDIKVIWVTVSQNSILHLQKVIAKSIDLDLSDEFEVKRIAGKLFQAFEEMNKCVIILDDVWDHFFLKDVGFPMSDNRIILILTTRIREVYQGMDCKKVIEVEPLDEKESWDLFNEFLGLFREALSSDVENIAWDVAEKCEGLPLAIVRIATSMKWKVQAREWRYMLECLENLGNGKYEMDKWVFPVLRSSYDFLNNKLQTFFLYCALSTNGVIKYKDADCLIRRFVYESIDGRKKFRVQCNESYNMLGILENHSMLDCDYGGERMINKFLRALAICIAENTCGIMAKSYNNLTEIPSDDQWKEDLQQVFLTGNKIQTIPNGTCLNGSQLSMLFLDRNAKLNYISNDFFSSMPALKTLDLSETGIKRLPKSVSNLKFLIALLLSGCRALSYVPSLRKLKRLVSLDLSFTAITKLPAGFESLVNLRCLNLLPTDKLEISASLKSKLINLEYLEVGSALYLMDVTGQDKQGLKNLEDIAAYFHDISLFNSFVSFLARNCVTRSYCLSLQGDAIYDLGPHYIHRYDREYSVKKMLIENMILGNEVVLPRDMKELVIKRCQKGTDARPLCGVLSYSHDNNAPQIELLDISNCEDLDYLCCCKCSFCSSSQLVGRLELFEMNSLKDLVSPSADSLHQSTLFSNLTHLKIQKCNSMKTLMPSWLLALFQNLRTIDVTNCRQMKEIVGEDHSVRELPFPMLTSLELCDMPQLQSVYKGILSCPSLQKFSALVCEELDPPQIAISNNGSVLPMQKTFTGYRWPRAINEDALFAEWDTESDED